MSGSEVIGKTCSICSERIEWSKPVVICAECDQPYHSECYTFNGCCATFGCSGAVGEPFYPGKADVGGAGTLDLTDLVQTYCTNCGQRLFLDAKFCGQCGTPRVAVSGSGSGQSMDPRRSASTGASESAAAVSHTPWPGYERAGTNLRPAPQTRSRPVRYAGFGIRLAAFVLDTIFMFILGLIIGSITGGSEIAGVIISVSYYGILQGSTGQTAGKAIAGIKVQKENGDPITIGTGIGRWLGMFISGLILCIGYLMAAWTDRHQALHDMMAGTVVVYVD